MALEKQILKIIEICRSPEIGKLLSVEETRWKGVHLFQCHLKDYNQTLKYLNFLLKLNASPIDATVQQRQEAFIKAWDYWI